MNELQLAAEVLEKMAVYIDAIEAEKTAAVKAERERLMSTIREKLSATTGEVINDDVINKLAVADPVVLAAIEKLALAKNEDLGSPSNRTSANAPATKDEAVKMAGDKLIQFAVS